MSKINFILYTCPKKCPYIKLLYLTCTSSLSHIIIIILDCQHAVVKSE